MSTMITEKITLWGIVQGVGFRPFVSKLADRMRMKGDVRNTGGLVEITLTDTPSRIDAFLYALQQEKPDPAEIVHIKRDRLDRIDFKEFQILGSAQGGQEAAMIPPDMAICPHCLKELYAKDDPRHQHPFISCMLCGPRYSIIDRIPYDRENTSMEKFPMCGFCQVQYTDLHDRRHHAQTISCHACGPYLKWKEHPKADSDPEGVAADAGMGADPASPDGPAGSALAQGGPGGSGHQSSEEAAVTAHAGASASPDEDTRAALRLIRKRSARLRAAAASSDLSGRHTSADDRKLLNRAATILANGGIIAFKSVGGYNLVADPFNEEAVRKLRQIKERPAKPFAVMFRDLAEVRYYCDLTETEARLLESSARPILLLEHHLDREGFCVPVNRRFPYDTYEGDIPEVSFDDLQASRFIGAFLPSLGAQYLLLDRISPLIFTSANKADLPMIKDEDAMMEWFDVEPGIDGVLYNERQIRVRMDDSVARVIDGQPQMIRRSKGYAPLPLHVETAGEASSKASAPGTEAPADSPEDPEEIPAAPDAAAGTSGAPRFLFAAGGQLKNSFALTNGPFLYMSQYFGDMDTVENQQIYQENVMRMARLLRIRPQAVVCDMHPLYETTRLAKSYAKKHRLPLLQVQHHHAHVASVMAENDLTGPVIGVSFDGTGYGTDGCIWGGEILLCEGGSCQRLSHLKYIDMIGGDASMKDARRSAFSYLAAEAAGGAIDLSATDEQDCRQFSIDLADIIAYGGQRLMGCPDARMILTALDSGVNTIRSSSMGRLFDAVSALLGFGDYNHYEGQCAMALEDGAAFAQAHPGEDPACDLALAFHDRIIDAIVTECAIVRRRTGADQVALTGGTFQNRILMEGALDRLRQLRFRPYYNISVSPGDGGIALGQAYIAMQLKTRT